MCPLIPRAGRGWGGQARLCRGKSVYGEGIRIQQRDRGGGPLCGRESSGPPQELGGRDKAQDLGDKRRLGRPLFAEQPKEGGEWWWYSLLNRPPGGEADGETEAQRGSSHRTPQGCLSQQTPPPPLAEL